MDIKSIEDELVCKYQALKQMAEQAGHAVSIAEYKQLQGEVLRLERMVAKKNGRPYAEEWSIPEAWAGMALNCLVVGDEINCWLVYEAKPKSGNYKILEFRQIGGYKLTDVSDEIIGAHSLAGEGLTAYGAFRIKHSPWVDELELVNKSHPHYDAERWRKTKHYLLCFKDRMFEVLAIEAILVGEAESRETATNIALERLGLTR